MVLALSLAAAGAWNYHRNWRAEQQEFRPYRSYAEADLAALIRAQEREVDGLTARYQTIRERRVEARDRGLLGDQLAEFERVQRASREVRDAGARLSEREAALRDLRAERSRRDRDADRLRVFLRRLLSVPALS